MARKRVKGLTPIGNDLPLEDQELKSVDTRPPDSKAINLLAVDVNKRLVNLPDEEANKLRGMKSNKGSNLQKTLSGLSGGR